MRNKTFKELREQEKITQSDAARCLNISKEYLSMIENAARKPSDDLKYRMSILYKVDISKIFLAIEETKRFKLKQMIKV